MDKPDNSIFRTLLKVRTHLPRKYKWQLNLFFASSVAMSLLESMALGLVAVFVTAVAKPEALMDKANSFFHTTYWDSAVKVAVALGLAVVLAFVVKNSLKALFQFWSARFSANVAGYYGKIVLNGFMRMPYEWFLDKDTADLIQTVGWRGSMMQVFNSLLMLITNLFFSLTMFVTLLVASPMVFLLIVFFLGCTSLFIFFVIRRTLDSNAVQTRESKLATNRHVTRAMHGFKDVKIVAQERSFLREFNQEVFSLSNLLARQRLLSEAPSMIVETVSITFLVVTIFLMLFTFHTTSAMMTGTMALIAVTAWKVIPAINSMLSQYAKMRTLMPTVRLLIDHLDEINAKAEYDELPQPGDDLNALAFDDSIRFEDMAFGYSGGRDSVLSDLNLDIPRGGTIGIIGTSGAGKSTFADLLIGLLVPTRGRILIDNVPLRVENRSAWLNKIGYVSQSPYIFPGTLAENVAFGLKKDEIDPDKILTACDMAAMDFLHGLPEGMDTHIGERGVQLSGGQRQRVAIARALYHDPEVMIFDEATSSLDTGSEKSIQETIFSLKGRVTLIIIAHRLTTVEDCDELIWIDSGRLRMKGAPEEILPLYLEEINNLHGSNNNGQA